MVLFRLIRVKAHERALVFRNKALREVLGPGTYMRFGPSRVDVVSTRQAKLVHLDLDVVVKSGRLGDDAVVVDLRDGERALAFVDNRFDAVLGPGLHVYWSDFHLVRVETVDARSIRFEHERLPTILETKSGRDALESFAVEPGFVGLFYRNGALAETLPAGTYAFWRGAGRYRLIAVDLREQVLDVSGQDVMTADKVTLRLNAVVTWKVVDAAKTVTEVTDLGQTLYREAQLAVRGVVGTKELDRLLSEKDEVARELEGLVRQRAATFGVEVRTLGLRDVILPGEMKDLLNKVTEARKAAEATLITRREETAAIRSQANTARILESSPVLMRLRELEVLEKVADKANLTVVLGEGGLADKVVKLL